MSIDFDWTINPGFILAIGSYLFVWWRTRRQDVDNRLAVGSKRMDALERRIQAAEQTLAMTPGREDMHKLELTLVQMGGEMKAQSAVLEAMAESVRRTEGILGRHEDFLREAR